MTENFKWVAIISVTCTALSAILGVIVYIRQQKINRIQNLIAVFQRFSNNDDFITIFSLCDSCYVRLNDQTEEQTFSTNINQLQTFATEKKYKYLALLEEIAIYAKNSAIISKNAIHLFKFHFYFIYGNHQISSAFWHNIGSGVDEKIKRVGITKTTLH